MEAMDGSGDSQQPLVHQTLHQTLHQDDRNQLRGQLPWVYAASEFAQDGRLHLCILTVSVSWVVLSLSIHLFRRRATSPGEPISRHWPWEIVSIAALMVAANELKTCPSFYQLDLALGWSVMLRWTRLWSSTDVQGLFLHQSTLIVWLSAALLGISSLLPCIDATTECAPSSVHVRAMAGLVVSAMATTLAPRLGTPPPEGMPVRNLYSASGPASEQTCSAFEWHCTYGWINPMVSKTCAQRGLHRVDIPQLPWYNEPLMMMREMREAREWGKSTLWALIWFTRWELAGIATYTWLSCATEYMAPFGLYHLLRYLANPDEATIRPWAWLALIFVGSVSTSLLFNQHHALGARFVMRTEAGCKLDLYQRAMESMELDDETFEDGDKSGDNTTEKDKTSDDKTSDDKGEKALSATTTGRIANLMSSDIVDVHYASRAFHNMCRVPVGIGVALVALYHLVGWIALAGTCVLILGLPFSIWVASKVQTLAGATQDIRDARISVVSEYLSAIRAIKYFAWEDVAVAKVDEVRQAEQNNQWAIMVVHLWPGQLSQLVPYITLLVVFSLYVTFSGQSLDAATGFTTMFLLAAVKQNADLVGPMVGELIKAILAFKRIDKFFDETVVKEAYPVSPLKIRKGTFRRSKKATFVLKDVSIDFVEAGLNVVVGPSGSGKTTLLLAILGETVREGGEVTRPSDVAFASQSAWLQNMTIRDNILFQADLDSERYQAVVDACCLCVDFDELPQRDLTRVGENGSALSGGQRARVALARALYSQAPLLLLDDIFSTLDAKTAARIWDKCFCSDMLKGRTVVLVTQIPWIASQGDLAVSLCDGVVQHVERHVGVTRGHGASINVPSELQDMHGPLSSSKDDKQPSLNRDDHQEPPTKDHEFEAAEKHNRIAFYRRYVGYFGAPTVGAFCFFMLILAKSVQFIRSASLSTWVEAPADFSSGDNVTSSEHIREVISDRHRLFGILFYLGIYGFLSILESVTDTVSRLCFSIGSWNAGRRLHHDLVNAVMHTDLSWFGSVPVGNIIARLSGDMNIIDHVWNWMFFAFVSKAVGLIFQFGAVAAMLPAFVVPIVVAAVVGIVIGERYSVTATTLTRFVDSSQAPVYSQFADSLSGLAVIRAREGMPRWFAEDLAKSLRQWSASKQAQLTCHRWVSVRLDFISACLVLATGCIAVSKAGVVAAGLAGLSLSNARELNENLLALVRSMNALETDYPSLERIEEYIALESEDKNDDPYPPEDETAKHAGPVIPQTWPATGTIEFRNATIRYDPDGPDILTNINLKFTAGERVAIVGRTGAGKSTLVLAMLRFASVVSGQILYDGIDITKVPRNRLRQGLTIIPQEATLLKGTVAYNLDPTGRVPQARLQSSLDLCRDIAAIRPPTTDTPSDSTTQRGISLSTPVAPLGDNFSHGQRQVLSLCRALVRDTRLMLLDEATASMDYETDRGIQSVLRMWVAEKGDATLVTIAHRLRTIIDYDTVVVMGGGKVLEAGSPRAIYANKGAFYDMVQQSGEVHDLEGALI